MLAASIFGLTPMDLYRQEFFEQLRSSLYQNDVMTGEITLDGITLEMMLGCKSTHAIEDIVTVSTLYI